MLHSKNNWVTSTTLASWLTGQTLASVFVDNVEAHTPIWVSGLDYWTGLPDWTTGLIKI